MRKYTGPVWAHPEHIAVGVADPEQSGRAGNRRVLGLALQENQFRRRRRGEDRRRIARGDPLARQRPFASFQFASFGSL